MVLVLFVLAVVTTTLAVAARQCIRTQASAAERSRLVQARWAHRSCQLLLPRAEHLLRRQEERNGKPVSRLESLVSLGDQRCLVIVADEQAKVNVNWLASKSSESLEARIASLSGVDAGQQVVRLCPLEDSRQPSFPAYGCFEQLFPEADARELLGSAEEPGPAADLTCWGDERMNAKRASVTALACACDLILRRPETNRLVRFKHQHPEADTAALVTAAQAPSERSDSLRKLLADSSACYSVWVVPASEGAASLAVREEPRQNVQRTGARPPRTFHFHW
jgi:hypothetical protein